MLTMANTVKREIFVGVQFCYFRYKNFKTKLFAHENMIMCVGVSHTHYVLTEKYLITSGRGLLVKEEK